MTTGQLTFYSGLALLGLTIITAILFLVKKPTYIPENAVYESAETSRTQQLRNGYPTERETIRREGHIAATELVSTENMETAAVFSEEEGDSLPPTEKIDV